MSVTLATIADALIEFILSLLRDPDTAGEFDEDPRGALAARGLSNISAADVCAVAPVVIDRPMVLASASPSDPSPPSTDPVVRQIQEIVNNFQWVDDRDTVVDQSVNQNIWAEGDVTQVFDQAATVASGDDAIAAGDDVEIDQSEDNSTTITAGGDANVGNDVTETTVDGSYNETVDSSTSTDASTDVVVEDSFDGAGEPAAEPAVEPVAEVVAAPAESAAVAYTEANSESDAASAFDDAPAAIVEDVTADDDF